MREHYVTVLLNYFVIFPLAMEIILMAQANLTIENNLWHQSVDTLFRSSILMHTFCACIPQWWTDWMMCITLWSLSHLTCLYFIIFNSFIYLFLVLTVNLYLSAFEATIFNLCILVFFPFFHKILNFESYIQKDQVLSLKLLLLI